MSYEWLQKVHKNKAWYNNRIRIDYSRDINSQLPCNLVLCAVVICSCVYSVSFGLQLDSDQESTDGEECEGKPQISNEPDQLTPDWLLYRAARVHNLPVMSQALALGANTDWINPTTEEGAVIHQAVLSGSVMACEYLLLNGTKIDAVDGSGNTALHLASVHRSTAQVCLLLKHRADHKLVNSQGLTALDIALQNCDADTVTILKIAEFKEEMKEAGEDANAFETWNEVMADLELKKEAAKKSEAKK